MIDIHCHILPQVDDGASDLPEALEMARMAWDSGVTDIVATPHFRGEWEDLEDRLEQIRLAFDDFCEAVQQELPQLRLHRGAEILCLPETPELARNRKLPALAGTDYVLAEFFFDESFDAMDEMLEELTRCGYRVVVAHPERYIVFQHRPELLENWVRKGYVLQMNKGSVLGLFGRRVAQTAHEILGRGLVHIFASDGHSSGRRTPYMEPLVQWTERYCTRSFADILLQINPGHILRGEPMEKMD